MGSTPCGPDVRRGRLAKARGFHAAALDIVELAEGNEINDAAVTLLVHAGIAAADGISCARLGVHASGDNHNEAVALLGSVDQKLSRFLASLLALKTKAGYSHTPMSPAELKKATRAAQHLVDAARLVE